MEAFPRGWAGYDKSGSTPVTCSRASGFLELLADSAVQTGAFLSDPTALYSHEVVLLGMSVEMRMVPVTAWPCCVRRYGRTSLGGTLSTAMPSRALELSQVKGISEVSVSRLPVPKTLVTSTLGGCPRSV